MLVRDASSQRPGGASRVVAVAVAAIAVAVAVVGDAATAALRGEEGAEALRRRLGLRRHRRAPGTATAVVAVPRTDGIIGRAAPPTSTPASTPTSPPAMARTGRRLARQTWQARRP